jgi:hypothetical protein
MIALLQEQLGKTLSIRAARAFVEFFVAAVSGQRSKEQTNDEALYA